MGDSFQRHFYYWILPTFYLVTLGSLLFTGVPLMRTIISPEMNREFGLLESTQHLLILAVIWMAIHGLRHAEKPLERFGFSLAAILATVQLLEEINYGQHYLALFELVPAQDESAPVNLHNIEGVSSRLKRVGDAVILLYFFLFPLLARQSWPAWLRYLAPPRLIAASVFCSVLVSKFLHYLSDNTPHLDVLVTGISEFREAFTYYFVCIYVWELARNRRWPGFARTDASIYRDEGKQTA